MRQQQKYAIDNLSNQNQTALNIYPTSQELAWKIAEAADDKKAADIAILQVEDVSYLTDYFVIATGFSKIQVKAIADAIEEKMTEQFQINPVRIEGKSEGNWIVQDYGEVIVHLFLPSEREYYNLEAFWGHAKRIEFSVSK
jgi:ribosome-associated protein